MARQFYYLQRRKCELLTLIEERCFNGLFEETDGEYKTRVIVPLAAVYETGILRVLG